MTITIDDLFIWCFLYCSHLYFSLFLCMLGVKYYMNLALLFVTTACIMAH